MKKFILGCLVVAGLALGGYYIFWQAQATKLEKIMEDTVKSFNRGDDKQKIDPYNVYVHVSHDKIKKSGFPFRINLTIPNTIVDVKTPIYDFDSYDKNHSEEKPVKPSGASSAKTSIEESFVTSDLMLKNLSIRNTKLIRYEDDKGEISIIDTKPVLKLLLRDSALNNYLYTIVDLLSITDKLKSIEYSDNGYKTYNKENILREQSNAKNIIKIDNLSDSTNFNFEFFVSYHNKDNRRYEKRDANALNTQTKTEQIVDFLGYSDLDLDLSFKSNRLLKDKNNLPKASENYLFNFNIKKFNWDFINTGLKIDGSFTASDKDMFMPVGIINHMLLNFDILLDNIKDLKGENDNKMIEGLQKILPEIANEILNNGQDLKIVYSRKEGEPAMLGKKLLEEIVAEYENYIQQKPLKPIDESAINLPKQLQ